MLLYQCTRNLQLRCILLGPARPFLILAAAFCYVVIEALMPAANVFVFAFVYGYGYFANPIAITRG